MYFVNTIYVHKILVRMYLRLRICAVFYSPIMCTIVYKQYGDGYGDGDGGGGAETKIGDRPNRDERYDIVSIDVSINF